jgi:hypothetical protein
MLDTRRPALTALGALTAALLVTGCVGGRFDFRVDDPSGYLACRDVTASRLADDNDARERFLAAAAANAAAAQIAGIRGTVDPPVDANRQEFIGAEDRGQYTVDADALAAACEDAGFQPDHVELSGS